MILGNGIQKFNRFKTRKDVDKKQRGSENNDAPLESTLDELVDHATILRNEGEVSEAIDLFEMIVKSGSHESMQLASYELGLLYSQIGNHVEADKHLQQLGFTLKLKESILQPALHSNNGPPRKSVNDPVKTFDNVLPATLLAPLKAAFGPSSAFWSEHNYPTDMFFSYNVKMRDELSLMTQLIDHILPLVTSSFSNTKSFSSGCSVEWWCHMRDNSSGFAHQLHFDLDEQALRVYNSKSSKDRNLGTNSTKNRTSEVGLRNGLHPSVSAVLYLSEQSNAAPTLVTDQTLDADSVASQAWLCYPKENRLLLFDGKLLHGVVPFLKSNLIDSTPRITLMMGFWDKEFPNSGIKGLGPNMPMPNTLIQQKCKTRKLNESTWPSLLKSVPNTGGSSNREKKCATTGLVHIPGPIWVPVEAKIPGSGVKTEPSGSGKNQKRDKNKTSESSSSSGSSTAVVNTDSDFISIADLNKLRGAPSVGVSDDDDEEEEEGEDFEDDNDEDDDDEIPKQTNIMPSNRNPKHTKTTDTRGSKNTSKTTSKTTSKSTAPHYGDAVEFISIAELNKLRQAEPIGGKITGSSGVKVVTAVKTVQTVKTESLGSKKKNSTTAPSPNKSKRITHSTGSKKRKSEEENQEIVFVGKWFLKSLSDIRDDVLTGEMK